MNAKSREKEIEIQKNKGTMYIGIDPDNQESGVGIVYKDTRQVQAYKMDFPRLISFLRLANESTERIDVIIEGGWLNKSNWHVLGRFMSTRKAAAIGRSAGMNHQTGILIQQMCESIGIHPTVVKPLKKCWKGKDGKITQDEAKYFMGNDIPRMNQDQRDALLLAWVYAGLPVKVAPKKPTTTLQKTIGAFDG